MKCFDSSSTDMNRKPMTWRKLAQRMNLNRWKRLHHCQFILLHACIARRPRPKVGREGLVGRQGRQGCQGGGMTCWWVVWSWYPGKSLEHRPNYLLILYWSLLCIKEMKKICIYKCKRLYMILKRHILYILTGYFTTGMNSAMLSLQSTSVGHLLWRDIFCPPWLQPFRMSSWRCRHHSVRLRWVSECATGCLTTRWG